MNKYNSKTEFFYLNNYLLYIYIEQGYKSLLPFNEEDIYENVSLVVVNINYGTKKVVNMKISHFYIICYSFWFNLKFMFL